MYEIIGAHWVTLAGYTPNQLVIHDPSARSGDGANEYLSLELIDSGTMTGNFTNLPRAAAGYYKVADGLKINTSGGANVAILSGAVVLEIK